MTVTPTKGQNSDVSILATCVIHMLKTKRCVIRGVVTCQHIDNVWIPINVIQWELIIIKLIRAALSAKTGIWVLVVNP